MTPSVSIILVNYNGVELLKECLRSLFEMTSGVEFEVIVIDNASDDGSVKMVGRNFPTVRLIESNENLGFSRGNNRGADAATGEYLLFLNTDTIVRENSVKVLADYLFTHTTVGSVGPRLVFENGRFQLSAGMLPNLVVEFGHKITYGLAGRFPGFVLPLLGARNRSERRVGWLTGACLMVRKDVFVKVGGFDEQIFMYYEDKDLSKRIQEAGWDLVYLPETTVVHLLGGSSRSVPSASTNKRYRESQIHYYRKHLGKFQTALLRIYCSLSGKI